MNAPDRYEKFVVPEGVNKIDYQRDTKQQNAGTFIIQREDHTVGNLIRMQLHRDKKVKFAGYKVPHPLEYQMLVKVQTSDSTKSPILAMKDCLNALSQEVLSIKRDFSASADKMSRGQQGYGR